MWDIDISKMQCYISRHEQNRKHVEKESTFAELLQRIFRKLQMAVALRGRGRNRMEHGFGVAALNHIWISADGNARYREGCCTRHLQRPGL